MTAVDLLGPANAPGAVTARPVDSRVFGTADTWHKDCTNPDANDGTEITAAYLNGVLGQLRNAVRGMGAAIDNTSDDMLLHAIQLAMATYSADSGSADAVVITHSPPWAAYTPRVFAVMWGHANATTTPTINVDGLGAKSLIHYTSRALKVGELQANRCDICIYDGASVRVVTPVLPGFNTMIVYSVAGSYAFTPPAGVTKVRVRGRGAGGGGGTSDTGASGAAGGEGGEFEGYFDVTPGSPISVVVGVKGIGGGPGGAVGATGGTTAFGPWAFATGGGGGQPAFGGAASGGGSGGTASGGQRLRSGQIGQASNGNANSNYPVGGGEGGSNNFGSATAPGSGGGPGNNTISGGNGADGEVVIEYAA